jgi:uncharacterized protein
MPSSMTRAEREDFLAGVHVAVLSVNATDGSAPLMMPVWYSYRPGGTVNLTTGRHTRKAAAIAGQGRFSLCVQDERPPFKYVTVQGPAVIADADRAERLEIAQRYLGSEGGEAFVAQNPGTDDIVIRLTPERWLTADYGKAAG